MRRNVLTTLILFVSLFCISPSNTQAIVKFDTDFQNYYRVDPDGNTHVSFIINQKNNLSVVYATDFGLNINETKINNVKVFDEGTIILPEIVKTLNQTTISFPFANKVVGKDKVHSFSIEYDTTDVATKYGATWQINIPKLETDENISNRTVILSIPENFPKLAYIDPKPDTVKNNVYYFNSNKIGNKTISAVFGDTQYYQGSISYHLINESSQKNSTEIALPPDTSYQSVYFQNIDPKPESIRVDEDGNYLAKYTLNPNSKLDIKLTLYVRLSFLPQRELPEPNNKYVNSNQIWNYENSAFTIPETKNLTTPKAIYDFVVDKFQYDYEKVNRQKSQTVPAAESLLNHESAICTDFSNVFVSLARKAGIPSRELQGYALSENPDLKPVSSTQDILHSWPEYYNQNQKTWIQIDPTWANTTRGIDYFNKLDFNHIVFAIHGQNSSFPIPAGGYKYKQEKTRDITITPVLPQSFPETDIKLKQGKQNENTIDIQIDNTSGVSLIGTATVSGTSNLASGESFVQIPPYGNGSIKIGISNKPFIGSIKTKAIITINGRGYEQPIEIKSSITKIVFYAIAGFILGIASFFTWRLYLRRRKQKTSLYRKID